MYIRSTQGLGAGYLTDYDAELERWLRANPNVNPNAPGSGVPVNLTAPVANAGSSMLMDFANRTGMFSATVNPNASTSKSSTVPLTPLTPSQQAPSDASGGGVMCAQVMKTCPDGSQVGYDLKVKDRCVYLPCLEATGAMKPIGQIFEDAFTRDGWGIPPGWLAVGGITLAFVLFRK